MQNPTFTPSIRNAILLALGFTASAAAASAGCAARSSHELCTDAEVDYATCDLQMEPFDPDDPYLHFEEVCFDASEGCDPCDAEAITGAAIEQLDRSCTIISIDRVTLACGPDPESSDCCYKVQLEGDFSCSTEGRPLRVGNEAEPRVAALRTGAAWVSDPRAFVGLRRPQDGALLDRLRAHWQESARHEHASIAAFARVGLQLSSLGAPPALLRATLQAQADEIRHAQVCFGLAKAYGAAQTQVGPLHVEGCASTGMQLEDAVREAIFEGALGEGAAALEALEGARACEDPVVCRVLSQIAQDEQRHALLAYQSVKWALEMEPRRARAVIVECLRLGQMRAPTDASGFAAVEIDDDARGYGLISAQRRAQLRPEVWHELVMPVLTAMLQQSYLGAIGCFATGAVLGGGGGGA